MKLSWSAEADTHHIQDYCFSAKKHVKIAANLFQESCSEPIFSLSVCGHIPFKDRFPQKQDHCWLTSSLEVIKVISYFYSFWGWTCITYKSLEGIRRNSTYEGMTKAKTQDKRKIKNIHMFRNHSFNSSIHFYFSSQYFWWNKIWHSYIAPAWHQREAKMSSKIWLAFLVDGRAKIQKECLPYECREEGILPFASCWVEEHCCFLQWHTGRDQLVAKSLSKRKRAEFSLSFKHIGNSSK